MYGGTTVICRKYLVAGRVQGVFYRATAARHARELQICGHAKNLSDGRVEVLAYGDAAAMQEFVGRLWTGSSASKVTAVDVAEESPAAAPPTGFVTA
jgi:acylphosphatase